MNALDNLRGRIIPCDGLANEIAGAFASLVDFGHKADISAAYMGHRLAQNPTRQKIAIAEDRHRVD